MSNDSNAHPPSVTIRFCRRLFRWRTMRACLFVLLCLVTLVALCYVVENWRGKRAWEEFKREWEAKGERFDVASLVPPPVPDDQNFAMARLLAPLLDHTRATNGIVWNQPEAKQAVESISVYASGNSKQKAPSQGAFQIGQRIDLGDWQEYYRGATNFPTPPESQDPAHDVLYALGKFGGEMTEIEEAARRPYSQFLVQYQHGFDALLPHLSPLRNLGRLFSLRANARLAAGDTVGAASDVLTCIRLSESLEKEPLLISQLVRIAVLTIALQPVWEGLADHRWNDAQLAAFETVLRRQDFFRACATSLRGEKVLGTKFILDATTFQGAKALGQASDDPVLRNWSRAVPSGWLYQNAVVMNRLYHQLALPVVDPAARRFRADAGKRAEESIQELLGPRHNPYTVVVRLLLPALQAAMNRFTLAQTTCDQARIACALERHRLARGQHPDTLDALVPQFLDKPPHDVINGEQLKYRLEQDGSFLLWSVGWNESDDGGVVAMRKPPGEGQDLDQGDWVWRSQPAAR